MRILYLAALSACNGESRDTSSPPPDTSVTPDSDTDPTTPPAATPWSVPATALAGGTLLGAWTHGAEVWMVGGDLAGIVGKSGAIVRLDPAAGTVCIEEQVADHTLWWIHGVDADDWYAVGALGTIIHGHDGVRDIESVPTQASLFGVWATEDAVYAVGADVIDSQRGELWIRRDGVWSLAATTPAPLFKVWEDHVVGKNGAYRIVDDALVDITPPEKPHLTTVRGRTADDVWAVGGATQPEVWHFDGVAWTRATFDPLCSTMGLNGVWTAPGEDVWVAGAFGTMARFDGESWECVSPPLTFDHFHAVWKSGDDVWWAGGNLFDAGNNHGTIGRHGEGALALTTVTCVD